MKILTGNSNRPLAEAIATEARARGLETWGIRRQPLDHGALVPLWFLAEAGWAGPTVILGLSYQEGRGLTGLGEAIAAAAHASPGRIAIVASGDMSHRLTADAPCGFHPRAREFDEEFLRLVRSGDYRSIGNIAPGLRGLAAEDAVDSTLVAASAADWQSTGHRVLHYEGPFGVGYGVAILFEAPTLPSPGQNTPGAADGQADGAGLPRLARRSVEDALRGGREQPPAPAGEYLRSKRGVFVTIRHRDGRLRGCVGTFEATTPNVVAETWRNARLAAAEDSRFYPVTDDELDGLRFEVSVIQSPEDASSAVALDPRRYGVIVSTDDGRRGLLLPGIQEIETPGQQLEFAREKGGINPDEPVTIQRFQTDHFEEPA